MFKRVILFLLTNLLVILTISLVTSVLGLHSYLGKHGIDLKSLAIFCGLWGILGAFISLALSRFMAKHLMNIRLISSNSPDPQERYLMALVEKLANRCQLPVLPQVGIYDSPEMNAFATGPSKRRALLAVSRGLLTSMNQAELEGVLSHEISHIQNGDMVTMTLIQGVVNSFALFLSRIIAYVITAALSRSDNREQGVSPIFYLLTFLFDILFTLLGSLVTAAFSRHREYRADHDGAKLGGKEKMISALEKLQQISVEDNRAPSLANLKISHQKTRALSLWASHPPLPQRIKRLQALTYSGNNFLP